MINSLSLATVFFRKASLVINRSYQSLFSAYQKIGSLSKSLFDHLIRSTPIRCLVFAFPGDQTKGNGKRPSLNDDMDMALAPRLKHSCNDPLAFCCAGSRSNLLIWPLPFFECSPSWSRFPNFPMLIL